MVQKKEWAIPQTFVQQFAANEYVAACGDENEVYKFECDAGGFFGEGGTVFLETNGEEGLQIPGDQCVALVGYHPCGETHEAPTTDAFLPGYFRPLSGGGFKKVMVWRGTDGNNVHVTANLDINSWETAKS